MHFKGLFEVGIYLETIMPLILKLVEYDVKTNPIIQMIQGNKITRSYRHKKLQIKEGPSWTTNIINKSWYQVSGMGKRTLLACYTRNAYLQVDVDKMKYFYANI